LFGDGVQKRIEQHGLKKGLSLGNRNRLVTDRESRQASKVKRKVNQPESRGYGRGIGKDYRNDP